MTIIDIKPGQWVLAFHEPYGPHNKPMSEHLEMFVHEGGGWDGHRKNEILHVYQVVKVGPKTYEIGDYLAINSPACAKSRQSRSFVIAAGDRMEAMTDLRKAFFAIGKTTSDKIHREMYRRIEKFAEREEANALKKIHQCLPGIFGGQS